MGESWREEVDLHESRRMQDRRMTAGRMPLNTFSSFPPASSAYFARPHGRRRPWSRSAARKGRVILLKQLARQSDGECHSARPCQPETHRRRYEEPCGHSVEPARFILLRRDLALLQREV